MGTEGKESRFFFTIQPLSAAIPRRCRAPWSASSREEDRAEYVCRESIRARLCQARSASVDRAHDLAPPPATMTPLLLRAGLAQFRGAPPAPRRPAGLRPAAAAGLRRAAAAASGLPGRAPATARRATRHRRRARRAAGGYGAPPPGYGYGQPPPTTALVRVPMRLSGRVARRSTSTAARPSSAPRRAARCASRRRRRRRCSRRRRRSPTGRCCRSASGCRSAR